MAGTVTQTLGFDDPSVLKSVGQILCNRSLTQGFIAVYFTSEGEHEFWPQR